VTADKSNEKKKFNGEKNDNIDENKGGDIKKGIKKNLVKK